MSTDAPATPPRKNRHVWRWFAVAALLFLAWFCWQLFGPNPPIIVSRETTFITEPLGPDGLPDYERYVWNQQKRGVTHENNAAVLLWQVIWPGELEPDQYAAMIEELELEKVPAGEHPLRSVPDEALSTSLAAWLKTHNKPFGEHNVPPDEEYSEQVDRIVKQATKHSWTMEQIPPLAKWVEGSRAALDLSAEATRRPRYYSPSPSYLDGQQTTLIAIPLPDAQGVRNVARAHSIRAMQYIGEGPLEEAWNDLLAVHHLARLQCQGATLVEQLIAISASQIACDGTVALLSNRNMEKELALRIRKDLGGLHEFSSVAGVLDQTERLSLLDAALQMRLRGAQELTGGDTPIAPGEVKKFRSAFDWNIVLKDINQCYDRLMTAVRITDRQSRSRKLEEFEKELRKSHEGANSFTNRVAAKFSKEVRSHSLSAILTSLMLPGTKAALTAEDRANTQFALTRLAAALAVYRTEHGDYPDSLDALVPDVLPELPVDLYHEKPFVYQRDGNGYLLYSSGPNGEDDGGSHEDWEIYAGRSLLDKEGIKFDNLRTRIAKDADDISIRVPVPPFKLPEPRSP